MAFQLPTANPVRPSIWRGGSFSTVAAQTGTTKRLPPKGSPSERLWIIAQAPLAKDADKGFLFSSPMGWSFDKLLQEAGLHRYFITYFTDLSEAVAELERYQPPIILALDSAAMGLCGCITKKEQVNLWAGSLLRSEHLSYPHYVIPTGGPETLIADWTERQVVKYCDLGKARDELLCWQNTGILAPLPEYTFDLDLGLWDLLQKFERWADEKIPALSIDIETIYPKGKSEFMGHPGYPITVGMAPNAHYGISFPLFWESTADTAKVWKAMAKLIEHKPIIGQNFFGFDAWFFEMLGMPVDRLKIHDTMFRHAVLWPELSHKLHFQTRQYTRQPYYKQEGHGWSIKELGKLKRYNALDVVTTYEIYNKQEEEFNERPHLR